MSNQTQERPLETRTKLATSTLPKTHPELQRLLDKEGGSIEYKPFGAEDSIKLSVKIVQDFIAVKTKSGRTCTERDARRFIMLCQAQRLNPWAGDAFLVGYDKWDKSSQSSEPVFSLITSHVAFLKRAEACADYQGMESGVILLKEDGTVEEREGDFCVLETDGDGNVSGGENVVGGWARVHRKDRKPTYRRLAISAMRPNYDTPFWNSFKAPGQIVKCAEADALRSTFPSLLGGLYMQEEQYDISRIVADAKPGNGKFEPASRLVETTQPEAPSARADDAAGSDVGPQPPQSPQPAKPSAVSDLEKLVTDGGFTFDHLQKWGLESGRVDGADSLSGFGDITEANAKRLLRIPAVVVAGLTEAKGGAK